MSVTSSVSTQCFGATNKGVQCKNMTKCGAFCYLHGDQEIKAARLCSGWTKNGQRCLKKTSDDSGFCHLHNDQATAVVPASLAKPRPVFDFGLTTEKLKAHDARSTLDEAQKDRAAQLADLMLTIKDAQEKAMGIDITMEEARAIVELYDLRVDMSQALPKILVDIAKVWLFAETPMTALDDMQKVCAQRRKIDAVLQAERAADKARKSRAKQLQDWKNLCIQYAKYAAFFMIVYKAVRMVLIVSFVQYEYYEPNMLGA